MPSQGARIDANQFDRLVRSFSAAGTRRGLLRLLAAVPLSGGVAALFNEEAIAAGRRKRRKKRHKHEKGQHQDHRTGERKGKDKGKKTCIPEPIAQTCAGTCAMVINRCGGQVDCGPCACESCPACRVCDPTTGLCEPHGATEGSSCGPGQVCHLGACVGNGACTGDGACQAPGSLGCGPATCGADIPDPDARSACVQTVEGGVVCVGRFFAGTILANFASCTATGTGGCPAGQVCTACNLAFAAHCLPYCDPRG